MEIDQIFIPGLEEIVEPIKAPPITGYFVVAYYATSKSFGWWKIYKEIYSTEEEARKFSEKLIPQYIEKRIYKL